MQTVERDENLEPQDKLDRAKQILEKNPNLYKCIHEMYEALVRIRDNRESGFRKLKKEMCSPQGIMKRMSCDVMKYTERVEDYDEVCEWNTQVKVVLDTVHIFPIPLPVDPYLVIQHVDESLSQYEFVLGIEGKKRENPYPSSFSDSLRIDEVKKLFLERLHMLLKAPTANYNGPANRKDATFLYNLFTRNKDIFSREEIDNIMQLRNANPEIIITEELQ